MYENQGPAQSNNVAGTALVFLAGGIVGATIALLMAPCSGVETRRRIGETASRVGGRVRDDVEGAVEKVRGNVEGAVEKVRDNVEHVATKVRENVDGWKDRAESRLANATDPRK